MVIILRRLVKQTIGIFGKTQNLFKKTMAWRSVGTDNSDLINQLEGKLIESSMKNKKNQNKNKAMFKLEYQFDMFGGKFNELKIKII